MKKFILILIISFLIPFNLFAQEYNNSSVSFDPLTLIGLLLGDGNVDFRNMWLAVDINWETEKQREMGLGLFVRGNRVGITTKYRFFHNKEKLSGFFWGLYGLIEWRRMYWFYDDNSEIIMGSSFPFVESGNVYHSIGITGGADIGFRFRIKNFGITPYLGVGLPLFLLFGDLPPQNNMQEFYIQNAITRAINIGLKLDFFF
jgi:hypothetical protein